MLYLYQSNQLETLSGALNLILKNPLCDPLQTETIVVQHPGIDRWLSQQIAMQTGIAANLNFPLPATFIWDIFEQVIGKLPDVSCFKRDVLIWRVLVQLYELPGNPAMQEIAHYLSDDEDGYKKLQLAGKITDLFDQYLVYRPEKILAWEQGKDRHWQATLWRQLSEHKNMHWAHVLKQFHQALNKSELHSQYLPERICFFGINALAPAYLKIIEVISHFTDVHLFHFSPCEEAWGDILSERELAAKRKKLNYRSQNVADIHFATGNPLLASMGKAGRNFFDLLMELNPIEMPLYQHPGSSSLLNSIQGDILNLSDRSQLPGRKPLPDDRSILFHSCHSPMREIQVLHDRLLDLFTADPDLKPADILVMAPNINVYAPFISGVFRLPGENSYIPWSIADRASQAEYPAIEAFFGLLNLSSSRFTAAEVMALAETNSIRAKFKLDNNAISSIRARIPGAGVRWGLDKAQRKKHGVDESGMQTWAFGIERLLLGYMTGPLNHPFEKIMPTDSNLTGTEAWLGSLATFIQALQDIQPKLCEKHRPDTWHDILMCMLEEFFDNSDYSEDLEGLRFLRESLDEFRSSCRHAAYEHPLSLALVIQYFNEKIGGSASGQTFLTGKVTFCSMIPMRSVPARVICLLGMNDTAYPRSQRPTDFDLIATDPMPGDRNQREADRYLFLETLLQARDHLSISWVGQNQQSNENQPPSVLVAELRDYIDQSWRVPDQSIFNKSSEFLTTKYPLQPFSAMCFDEQNPTASSYASVWLPAEKMPADTRFISTPLGPLVSDNSFIDIRELIRFWNHPVRYFLQQRPGLNVWTEEEQLAETEAFYLDNLQTCQLTDIITSTLIKGESPDSDFYRMQAAGELPRRELGQVFYEEILGTAHKLVDNLQPLIQRPKEPIEIDLKISGTHLNGWLRGLYKMGRVSYRPATCKPKDLMQLWIHHLVLLLTRPANTNPISTHVATDKISSFGEIKDPGKELERLTIYYRQGLDAPLHFYPATSYAWAGAKSPFAKMNAARKKWRTGPYNQFAEENDIAYKIALRGLELEDLLDQQFEELATLFDPVLTHLEQRDATI